MPFLTRFCFGWEGSPTKIDYSKKVGTLVLTSRLEHLASVWLRRFSLFAADFLECGGNFRRNALRQKFPPQEVLGMAMGPNPVPPVNIPISTKID